MSNNYPIESLLRSPIEWYSAVSCGAASFLVGLLPSEVLLTPDLGYLTSASLLLLGVHRLRQGYSVVRYQRHLKRLNYYALSSNAISVSQQKLFLGKGFRWQPIHTQRLYDCRQRGAEKYITPHRFYRWARLLEIYGEKKTYLKRITQLLASQSRWNPVRPLPPVGGNPALHGVELREQSVWMNLSERVGHTLVLGTTRVGKTRLLEVLVTQDIRRGDVVIVFDPKGDGDLLRRIYFEAKACGREDDVLIFHLGFPDVSARYNPVGHFARITEVANRIANQLPGSGESVAFKEFGWRFVNIIAKALVALGRKPDYRQIQRYILNIDHLLLDYCKLWLPTVDPNWEGAVSVIQSEIDERSLPIHLKTRSRYMIAIVNYIQRSQFYDPIADGLCSAFNYDKTYFDKITASLLPLIEKLTTGKSAELISPDYFDLNDQRPIFDWMQVIRGKKIVYVGLDALSDSTVAAAVGNSMFADLCSIAGQLYKFGVEGFSNPITPEAEENQQYKKLLYSISVHSDEFNELIGDEFIPLLNKAGGSGMQVTAYTQTWSDVEAKLGNRAKAGQVGGNLNTLICLRVLEEETAKLLTSKLPQRIPIHSMTQVSSVTDSPHIGTSSDFSSSNEDRVLMTEVPLLTADDLIQLPKGQAFCLLEGGQLWKIRMPLPKDDFQGIPDSVEHMALQMQKRGHNKDLPISKYVTENQSIHLDDENYKHE